MLGDDPPILADHDAVGIGLYFDRPADRVGGHRVLVVVEAHQAGLRHRGRHRVEAVEPPGIGDQFRAFRLEHLPDRLAGHLGMAMRLGVGDALVEQPGVELLVGLEAQPGREKALPHEPDLVLDLPLLPAGGRCAGHRLDQVVATHLQEAPIVQPVGADEDRLHRRLHVVVDAAPAGALEERERPVVRVEHHLLRLPRIDPHERHAAVTEPDMRGLHDHRHAAEQDDLVTPVELIGFPRGEGQRDVDRGRRVPARLAPPPGIAPHGIVAARIAAPAQVLEDPDERPLLTGRLGLVPRQQRVELGRPPAQLRPRLDVPVVRERRRPRPHHLADRIPRHAEIPSDLLDRLALEKIFTPNPANRLHRQHPPLPASDPTRAAHHASWQGGQLWTPIPPIRGSRLHAETQLYPSDPYLYGRALWFEEYGDTGLVAVIGLQIFRERVIAPSMMGRPTDDALVQKALDEGVPPLFNYLESQVKDGEFLCGSFSIADIGICTQLLSYRYSGYEPDPKRWPKFAAYAERVFARPSFQERLREEAGFARVN